MAQQPGGPRKWSRQPEDLSGERILRDCAKEEFEGVKRPVIGRIVLLAKLGKGGMGVVYFGVNPRLYTEVAVKVMPPEMEDKDDDAVDRFVREGRIAAGLFSEHLVAVLDVDRDAKSGAYFLVMEFVRGVTAGRWATDEKLHGAGPPSERDSLEVAIAATKGLAAAHLEGILHRDVKPENILVPKAHGKRVEIERAKLADLGLARPESAAEGITETAIGMGTPGYMAPEQARDARSAKKPADVFSMGATLYCLLTGDAPFRGAGAMDTMLRTMRGDHVPVRKRRPDVSAATGALLAKCLAMEPKDRFPDAAALLEAMEICRASLDTDPAPGETVGRIERLAEREERGKQVVSAPPVAPRPPGARRRRAAHPAKSPVGVFAALGVVAIAALVAWSALGGSSPATKTPAAPSPDAAAKPPGAVEIGIEVTSDPPGGYVEIDGQRVGEAPRFRAFPVYSQHDVRVTMPGHAPFATRRPVVVRDGGRTRVEARLTRAFNAVRIESAAPGGRAKLVRDGDPPKEYAATIDAVGEAALSSVEAGTYVVTIERAGFDPFKTRLDVPVDGAGPRVAARMKEHDGKLSVDSKPRGAAAFLDEKLLGKTPLADVAAPHGKHALVLRMAGYAEAKRAVEIRGDETLDAGAIEMPPYSAVDLSALSPGVVAKCDGVVASADTKLAPGAVVVVLTREGFASQTKTCDVAPGAPLVVREESWDKFQAQIDVSSLPDGARVLVDGVEMKGPVIGWASPRKARLDIRRPGFERDSQEFAVAVGKRQTLAPIEWKEVKTQLDLAELPLGTSVWIDGKPAKENSVVKPGPHVVSFSGIANAPSSTILVESQRSIRPPIYARDPSVAAALDWLARHQSDDGGWSPDRFLPAAKMKPADGPGAGGMDVGLTGLALSAFLGAGETPDVGPHKENVAAGLRWLLSRQAKDADGCIGPRNVATSSIQCAIATIAVCDAYRCTGDPALRDAARRAVPFLLKGQNPNSGWRYGVPPDGSSDTESTFWMVRALNAAVRAECSNDRAAIQGGLLFVEAMTDPEFGRAGYQQKGGPPARANEQMKTFPAEKSECLTAAAVLVRFWAGRDPKGDELIGKGAELMLKKLPFWSSDAGTIDFCYWHYGTLAMARVGGEHWKKWRVAGVEALTKNQRADATRDDRGSWDPIDCWGAVGGRVYATAINCLTLEQLGK